MYSRSIGMKVTVRAESASAYRVADWIESKAWRRAWVGADNCTTVVALSWGLR